MARPEQLWGNPTGADTDSSRDCFIDPATGGVSKRGGCTILNETSAASPAGLLNFKAGFKARKFFALDSPSMSNGYPIPAVLYGEDTNAGFPTADSGFPGTIYASSTNAAAATNALKNYSLLEEFFAGDTYGEPTTETAAADYPLRVVPIWYESGDGVYNRGALTGAAGNDQFMQQFLACGSRSIVQTQNWLYSANLRCTPWRWNKELNESSTTGAAAATQRIVRIYPTGPFPPLFPPEATTGTSASSGTTWTDGDTFYISVVFQFEDGSYSLPFVPRPSVSSTVLPNGLGRVTVGNIPGTTKYLSVTYSDIPIGPHGTVARVILRTPKQNRQATTDTITVEPLNLRVVGVLRNNTQTSYEDFQGDDDSLLEDNDVVRFDLVCPRRARYYGTGDQRVAACYTLPNTAAIMLALTDAGVGGAVHDKNLPDTDDLCYGATAFLVRITSTQLELHYNGGAAVNFATNAKAFLFSTYTTLQKLVDAINTTTQADFCKGWRAQLAPGVDGSMASTSLTLTTMDIACGTTNTSTTVTSAALFGPVGVGMKVKGTGITAGTYVVSKASASSLTLSTAATATGSPTLTFYQETGDNSIVDAGAETTVGYMRNFGPNWPLLLHCKPSAFPGYDKPDKTGVYFTMSSPGALVSGVSLAPNSWLAGNKLLPHSSPRQQMQRACTGIVDLEGAGLIAYTDGIYLFKNQRGGNSGEDFDCRLYTINDGRGCISYLGLTSGNGWAAYPTTQGIVVTDKNGREFVISGDVFNASDNTGDLANEIKLSSASAASDSDDQYLSVAVIGSKLAVAFRNSQTTDPRVLYYDFSPGVEASGIEEVLDSRKAAPYIWSPPALYNAGDGLGAIGAMGSIHNSSGRIDYIAYDDNGGSTGDGRLDQVNTSTASDNTTGFSSYATIAPLVATEFHAVAPQRLEVTHLTLGTAANIYLANNQTPSFNVPLGRFLNVDANRTQFQKQTIPIDNQQRGKADMFWVQWRSPTGSTSTSDRLWRVVLQYGEVESDTAMADLV